MEITTRKCPKCKSTSFRLIEIWNNAAIYFEVESSIVDMIGSLEPGNPVRIEGSCSCGYRWTLRGVKQIHEVLNVPQRQADK
jgi:RNA polymerase subunit RPABC4/transcription elongation factor Spt4